MRTLDSSTDYISGVDVDTIRRFIGLARPNGGRLMLLHISDQGGPPQSRTFAIPDEANDLVEWVGSHNAGCKNIYWLPNDTARDGKPAKGDMTAAYFAWADCDPDIKRFDSYRDARCYLTGTHADRLAPIASFVIDSGNGLQAFFRLSEPIELPVGLTAYERGNEAIGKALEGPGTFNCDRIMRVPGTRNWPTRSKLAKGYPETASMSRIIAETDRTYGIEELLSLIVTSNTASDAPGAAKAGGEQMKVVIRRDGAPPHLDDLLKSDAALRARWSGSTDGLDDTSGSAMDLSLYSMLVRRGFIHSEIVAMLQDWPHGGSGRQQGDRYWERLRQRTAALPPTVTDGETDCQVAQRLAMLGPMDYDRVRKAEADRLGVKVSTLDRMIASARNEGASSDGETPFPEVRPWDDAVDGAILLSEITSAVQRFIVCDDATARAAALWVVMTWLMDSIDVAPIAAITAPEMRCGKSQMLSVMGRLVRHPLAASNITSAALFRSIEAWRPTLLIDEADAFMKENEELRGLLNCGHTRDSAFVVRTVGDDHAPKQFFVWGAKAIAGIGHLAATLMDRSVKLELRRKLPHEKVDKLRYAEAELFETLRAKLCRWAADNAEAVRRARPVLPNALNDRAADNWEPLMQIAETAGGNWPALAADAAITLSGSVELSQGAGAELLADIREVFEAHGKSRLFSADLLAALCSDDEKPWTTWNRGRAMTPRQLAKKLEGYGVKRGQIRIGYESRKGYLADQFADAFTRYLSPFPESTASEEPTISVSAIADRYGLM